MAVINENKLMVLLKKSKKVLLLEPPYRRSYVPLGLAKIASYIKSNGGSVEYSRGTIPKSFDLICISSVFTNDASIVLTSIKECERSLFTNEIPIVVGGIFASLMPDYIQEKTKASVFTGYAKELDEYTPDYSIDYQIKGFFKDAMTLFTTRGCPNKCGYCMVWRMEPEFYIEPAWKKNITDVNREVCVVSDNNFLSAPHSHIKDVIETLNKYNKKIIFNNGVDCRLINNENAQLLSSLTYIRSGFRTAFDRMEDDGHYQKAMEKMQKIGFKIKGNSYTYVLFNYVDTPQEAYYRATECWKYGSNPYLMRYRPLDSLNKSEYIGKYWTKNLIRAFSNYGQCYGYNRGDRTFEGWVNGCDGKWKYKSALTKEDWEKWNYKR